MKIKVYTLEGTCGYNQQQIVYIERYCPMCEKTHTFKIVNEENREE